MAEGRQEGILRRRKRMVDAMRSAGQMGQGSASGEPDASGQRSQGSAGSQVSAREKGIEAAGEQRVTGTLGQTYGKTAAGTSGQTNSKPVSAAAAYGLSDEGWEELEHLRYRKTFWSLLRSTINSLIVVAAIAVLISNQLFPVLRIYGHSMNETLDEGELVIALKSGEFAIGDVIAFYYNNKLLVKRVIGVSGDWIDIDQDGTVYVNNKKIDEPYIDEKAYGETNIELPYQVPESRIFVMGDNRAVSVDSRNTAVGCVAEEQIVGRIVFRIWPLEMAGRIH